MRLALVIGRRGGSWTTVQELARADVAKAAYRRLTEANGAGYDELQLWESSGGRTKHRRFPPPAPAVEPPAPAVEPPAPAVDGRPLRRR